jgi:hypothetical protein
MLAGTLAYCGAVYTRHALKARALVDSEGDPAEAGALREVLESEAIAWLAEGRGAMVLGGVELTGRQFATWEALAAWLCSGQAPNRTSVLLRRGPEDARRSEWRLSRVPQPPGVLKCASAARFYLVEHRLQD